MTPAFDDPQYNPEALARKDLEAEILIVLLEFEAEGLMERSPGPGPTFWRFTDKWPAREPAPGGVSGGTGTP